MSIHPQRMTKLLQYYVRHFPIDRGKNRAISLLWRPLSRGPSRSLETTLSQGNVKVKCDLQHLIQRQLYFWGSYEKDYCAHWRELARGASTIFDVGANVGVYSLLAAEMNPAAQIHAFEPTTAVFDALRVNISLNGFNNITANATAVGSRPGVAILRECRGSDGTNEGMNFVETNPSKSQASDQSVTVISLDDYCKENAIESIDVMKLDIEGGEYDALLGASGLLESQSISCLFIEFTEWAANRSGHSTLEIESLLRKNGYRLCRLIRDRLIEARSGEINVGENVIALPSGDLARLALN